jgi:aqualysin 1
LQDEPLRLHAIDAPEETDPTATDGPETIDVEGLGPREIGIHDHPTNWGLDRMDRFDQKTKTHANAYPFDGKYHYAYDGAGVEVFLLDTGVRSTHLELIGSPGIPSRVICGFDAFAVNDTDTSCEDKVGHGTFMAGAIGGIYYGVAKDVIINSVKVFNDVGQGTVSSAIAGLDYVIGEKKFSPKVPFVANLSFGLRDENMAAFQDALDATLKAGITIVTSSGNHGSTGGGAQSGNGCEVSPANFPGVISVAASTYKDEAAQYNDLGRCIDFFAPGDRVSGIWNRDDTDAVTISGSSIAAAHATGAAALILEAFPHFTPEHVRLALTDIAEEGSITGIPMYARTPNKLLNLGVLTFVPEWDGMESRTAM